MAAQFFKGDRGLSHARAKSSRIAWLFISTGVLGEETGSTHSNSVFTPGLFFFYLVAGLDEPGTASGPLAVAGGAVMP